MIRATFPTIEGEMWVGLFREQTEDPWAPWMVESGGPRKRTRMAQHLGSQIVLEDTTWQPIEFPVFEHATHAVVLPEKEGPCPPLFIVRLTRPWRFVPGAPVTIHLSSTVV